MKKAEKISFLLGSGFSVPAGYPTATELNKRLSTIRAGEICIHTSLHAWFLDGKTDPNAGWMGVEERSFVEEFLNFYTSKVLKPDKNFHYETFYDYYISKYRAESYPKNLLAFFEEFKRRQHAEKDNHYLLMEFNDTFSQLIAHLLSKDLQRIHHGKPYDPKYNNFFLLLEELAGIFSIHIHTLNHDLYLEYLSHSDCFRDRFDDGFEELGSPFYAKKYETYATYMVRLSRFIDKYSAQICLYKLHGSIDHYWCRYDDRAVLVKVPWGINPDELYIELDKEGKLVYTHHTSHVVPDFLSGTTHKVSRYRIGKYYPVVLKHFKKNLQESKTLIVIGYSFGDTRINQYLERFFLCEPQKLIFVVDVNQPKTDFFEKPNVHFVAGGVSGMDIRYILNKIEDF